MYTSYEIMFFFIENNLLNVSDRVIYHVRFHLFMYLRNLMPVFDFKKRIKADKLFEILFI